MQKTERTETINVMNEAGEHKLIEVFTTFTLHRTLNGKERWFAGAITHELNGEHCNPTKDGAFVVFSTDEVLRRV